MDDLQETEREKSEARISGVGALDFRNSQAFKDELDKASRSSDNVVVDLTKATFIDTAILQYLSSAATKMSARGSRLKLFVSAASHPYRVLKIVGFSAIMDIVVE